MSFLSQYKAPQVVEVTLDDGSKHLIRKLSQSDVEKLGKYAKDDTKQAEALRHLVALGLANPDGSRQIIDSQIGELADVPFDIIKQMAGEISEFAGLIEKKA